MANIWKEQQGFNNHPKRNNFDLTFQNHLSLKLGQITPIFCKPVVPGDSFDIQTAYGLKFAPMQFPVQSRMRAHMHFFYCRNKNLWKNWMNFIQGLPNNDGTTPVHPYISQPSSFFKTSSLCDYLDIPTTLVQTSGGKFGSLTAQHNYYSLGSSNGSSNGTGRTSSDPIPGVGNRPSNGSQLVDVEGARIETPSLYSIPLMTEITSLNIRNGADELGDYLWDGISENQILQGLYLFDSPLSLLIYDRDNSVYSSFSFDLANHISSFTSPRVVSLVFFELPVDRGQITANFNISSTSREAVSQSQYHNLRASYSVPGSLTLVNGNKLRFTPTTSTTYNAVIYDVHNAQLAGKQYYVALQYSIEFSDDVLTGDFPFPQSSPTKANNSIISGKVYYNYYSANTSDAESTPFGSTEDEIHINALPFRAYQSIYNCYFRNQNGNQPFYDQNGNELFNVYIENDNDGADTVPYHLYQRNYEYDFLTSALPSPQFGNAPMVGINSITGTITLEDENGISTFHADVDDDGNITKVVATSPLASIEHARTTMNMAALGMNINDFRNTNALQNFLEMTLRKGFRYIDFIEGHLGVKPGYKELDMPEFIGGTSQDVTVNQITNMAVSDGHPLGEFGGVANCFGSSSNSIRHYCDDYGWIIGVLTVVPEPAYTQLLPKHFLYSNQLDYPFPEFNQLGMQPITYKEVCPLQRYNEGGSLSDTFGYQRPNYDMVGYVNQVHGEFRTSLKDFLFNRIFASSPELGEDFLTINPDELNDVFTLTSSDLDTCYGQIILKVSAKRPFPRVSIPSLGR